MTRLARHVMLPRDSRLTSATGQWQKVKRRIAELIEQEEKTDDPDEKARLQRERQACEIKEAALNKEMKEAQAERRSRQA